MQFDIFCRVVDNYGDIGVCWRLARQLVAEHGCKVQLIVDDLGAFRFVAPQVDRAAGKQWLSGIEIVAWPLANTLSPSDVVIEAFACDPPSEYIEAMAARSVKPVWINLEYLSAEAWVDDIHGMSSQHQRLPLTKYFFCPGFTEASGGLIRERPVIPLFSPLSPGERVVDHVSSLNGTPRPCPLTPPPRGEGNNTSVLRIFAFAYPHAPAHALAPAFASEGLPSVVTLASPLNQSDPDWHAAPRVAQTEFDALLAQFDFLIVRGEDSFIRAQWAAKPFLWHIYPTDDGAHLSKLDAWLEHYCNRLEPNAAGAYRAASHAFNGAKSEEIHASNYALLAKHINALAAHAALWRDTLMQQTDLATRLVAFVNTHKAKNLG